MTELTVRRAVSDDAAAVRDVYGRGDTAEFARRLGNPGPTSTEYHLLEAAGTAVAVVALTELGRLSPGAPPRLLVHEMKIRASFRNTGVAATVFAWLNRDFGAGKDVEVMLLNPADQVDGAFASWGIHESHRVSKWPARYPEEVR
ncbi:hypothetical protein [Winogradskya humida]|uniref:N-acetyltransferase domain-containing protein n=1 Tax=Winogradskya humida TaxID=113566 RepID=A0ABQ3ZZ71_9ACTN|nr:hypothetical protein [Actinoplanes humidus]GIE23878.1 hypothetical protein Ahu01nite_069800 [Actinoplanes humidus]